MPLFAIIKQDIQNKAITQEQYSLDKYSIFKRGTIKDFIRAMAKEMGKRLPPDGKLVELRESGKAESFKIVTQLRGRERVFVVTDIDYESSVAYRLVDRCFEGGDLGELIKEYRDWEEKDQLKKINEELEKCNVVVMDGLSQILERGESLSDLVEKSEELNMKAKILFKTAHKRNSCC